MVCYIKYNRLIIGMMLAGIRESEQGKRGDPPFALSHTGVGQELCQLDCCNRI